MTANSPAKTHSPLPRLTSRLLFLLPLLATGCCREQALPVIFSVLVACGVLLCCAGFVIGVELCCRTHRHWEGVYSRQNTPPYVSGSDVR